MGNPRRILLVDDELELLELCGQALSNHGFCVDKTFSGSKAKELLLQNEFDALVTDLRLPHINGMELLRWVREHKPKTKVIVITGFAPVVGAMGAIDLGCDALLVKPFERQSLIIALERALETPVVEELHDCDYARIPVGGFHADQPFAHPLFLRLSDGRFLKIGHQSTDLEGERLQNLRSKGVEDLWVLKKDFQEYLDLSQQAVIRALSEDCGDDRRHQSLKYACEVAAENLRVAGVNEASLEFARKSLEFVFESLQKQNEGRVLLDLFFQSTASRSSHSILCGLLSGLVGRIMGHNQDDCSYLSLGGLICDIGLLQLDKELLCKEPGAMTPSELACYQQHPVLGLNEIKRIGSLGDQVHLIILQHHEDLTGKGYPGALMRKDISALAQIVRAVDEFCLRLLALEPTQRNISMAVLEAMNGEERGRFSENVICALQAALKSLNLEDACFKYEVMLHKNRGLV